MKLTHTIRLIFEKLHKDHHIDNHLIWDQEDRKFIPDNTACLEPIEHENLESEYTAAAEAYEEVANDYACHLKIETTLFLPIVDGSPLEELLDNTPATICTFPA